MAAHKIWEHYPAYNVLRSYSNLMTRSAFRKITVEGLENIPKGCAVMLAPNHSASLTDPMVMLATLTNCPELAFGARSDVFRNPKIAKILKWFRILPIARERNGMKAVAQNFKTFEEIYDCLDHNVPFTLYAEGTHRPERGMLPIKKGIFRIAREAHESIGKPIYIVPMGIEYEYFFREMGRLAVRVGKPLNVTQRIEELAAEGKSDPEIYRALCQWLQEADLSLIGQLPDRKHDKIALRILLAILTLPFFPVMALLSIPIWGPMRLVMTQMEDQAWWHTNNFIFSLIFPIFVPFNRLMWRMINLYRNILEDIRK